MSSLFLGLSWIKILETDALPALERTWSHQGDEHGHTKEKKMSKDLCICWLLLKLCLGCDKNTLTVGESMFGVQETDLCPKYNPEWWNTISNVCICWLLLKLISSQCSRGMVGGGQQGLKRQNNILNNKLLAKWTIIAGV